VSETKRRSWRFILWIALSVAADILVLCNIMAAVRIYAYK